MLRAALVLLVVVPPCRAAEPKVVAEGEWSKPTADNRGRAVRGRLVLAERRISPERREVAVYVELQDASEAIGNTLQLYCDLGRHDFRPEYKPGLHCELRDNDGKPVKTTPFPFSGAVPKSEWISLPPDATIRLRASPFGIHRPGATAICPDLATLWVIGDDDANEYRLSGTFTIDPPADKVAGGDTEHIWGGTIEFPAVKTVSKKR
jgi:hypothetical protein